MKELTQKYKLTTGEELVCRPVPPHLIQVAVTDLENQWREEGRIVDKPQFKVRFERKLGTAEVWADHYVEEATGRNSLDDPDDPRQTVINWALWKQYEADREALEEAQGEMRVQVLFQHGIDYDIPPPEEWADKIAPEKVADDPLDRKFQYLWFVKAANPIDANGLHAFLMMLTAGELVTDDQLARFRETLRPGMERAVGAQLDRALAELERVASGEPEEQRIKRPQEGLGDQ